MNGKGKTYKLIIIIFYSLPSSLLYQKLKITGYPNDRVTEFQNSRFIEGGGGG